MYNQYYIILKEPIDVTEKIVDGFRGFGEAQQSYDSNPISIFDSKSKVPDKKDDLVLERKDVHESQVSVVNNGSQKVLTSKRKLKTIRKIQSDSHLNHTSIKSVMEKRNMLKAAKRNILISNREGNDTLSLKKNKHIKSTVKSNENTDNSNLSGKEESLNSYTQSPLPGPIESSSHKTILRPSKLDNVTEESSAINGRFSKFGQPSKERKGKRQWKPSLKMQQHVTSLEAKGVRDSSIVVQHSSASVVQAKFGQTTFGSPMNIPSGIASTELLESGAMKNRDGNCISGPDRRIPLSDSNEQIDEILESRWGSSRLRKVENKFVKTGSRVGRSPSTSSELGASLPVSHLEVSSKSNYNNKSILVTSNQNCDSVKNGDMEIPSDNKLNDSKLKNSKKISGMRSQHKKPLIRQAKLIDQKTELKSNMSTSKENTPIAKLSSPLIRESKLKLNQDVLEQLRVPSRQVEFYQAIQRSMQSAERKPPKLIHNLQNPAGTALVSCNDDVEFKGNKSSTEVNLTKSKAGTSLKPSNRMPGLIVCGICGAVKYYSFILQAKKFGTFSCEPCRKFISKCIKLSKDTSDGVELFSCVVGNKTSSQLEKTNQNPGMCVVPPVIRKPLNTPQGTSWQCDKKDGIVSATDARCQACWLKLCLIGYNLEATNYDKLRLHLAPKEIFRRLLPASSKRGESDDLLPGRGKILEFSRQVPLSRPLFDGFGIDEQEALNVDNIDKGKVPLSDGGSLRKDSKNVDFCSTPKANLVTNNTSPNNTQTNETPNKYKETVGLKNDTNCSCVERLPNGWTKRAIKHVEGM